MIDDSGGFMLDTTTVAQEGSPIAYGWKFNMAGTEASICVVKLKDGHTLTVPPGPRWQSSMWRINLIDSDPNGGEMIADRKLKTNGELESEGEALARQIEGRFSMTLSNVAGPVDFMVRFAPYDNLYYPGNSAQTSLMLAYRWIAATHAPGEHSHDGGADAPLYCFYTDEGGAETEYCATLTYRYLNSDTDAHDIGGNPVNVSPKGWCPFGDFDEYYLQHAQLLNGMYSSEWKVTRDYGGATVTGIVARSGAVSITEILKAVRHGGAGGAEDEWEEWTANDVKAFNPCLDIDFDWMTANWGSRKSPIWFLKRKYVVSDDVWTVTYPQASALDQRVCVMIPRGNAEALYLGGRAFTSSSATRIGNTFNDQWLSGDACEKLDTDGEDPPGPGPVSLATLVSAPTPHISFARQSGGSPSFGFFPWQIEGQIINLEPERVDSRSYSGTVTRHHRTMSLLSRSHHHCVADMGCTEEFGDGLSIPGGLSATGGLGGINLLGSLGDVDLSTVTAFSFDFWKGRYFNANMVSADPILRMDAEVKNLESFGGKLWYTFDPKGEVHPEDKIRADDGYPTESLYLSWIGHV